MRSLYEYIIPFQARSGEIMMLFEQHTSYSPYDRLIEKVGFPMTEERQKNS